MERPKLRVPMSAKNEDWYRGHGLWSNSVKMNNVYDTQEINDLYDLVTGRLDLMRYRHVTHGYGDGNTKGYPAKLINFDIISPMIMQTLTYHAKQIYEPTVYAKNTDVDTVQEQYEIKELITSLQQSFINYLIQQGEYVPGQTDENGQPIQEPQHPDTIRHNKSNIRDIKAMQGQDILDYIMQNENVKMKWRQMFFDYIVCNTAYDYATVVHDDVRFTRVDPRKLRWYGGTNVTFVKDADVIVYRDTMSMSSVIDLLQDKKGFNMEVLESLDRQESSFAPNSVSATSRTTDIDLQQSGMGFDSYTNSLKNTSGDDGFGGGFGGVTVTHHQFTAYDKVGCIKTTDFFGREETVYVDETYIESEGEEIEWKWCAGVYQCWMIDDKHLVGYGKVETAMAKFENPNVIEKSYNGRVYMSHTGFKFDSLAKKLYAYQELYNIIKFKIQYTINKNKDKLAVIPIGLLGHFKEPEDSVIDYDAGTGKTTGRSIKNKNQSSIAQALYYADTTQLLFVDESSENAALALQMLKELDLSMGNYIQYLYQYLTQIKDEAGELIGMNRVRRSQISASDAVSNVQQADFQGSLIIEEYMTTFQELQDSDCNRLVSLAKLAYRNGKRASFIRSDGEQQLMNIEPYAIAETEYGIFSTNARDKKTTMDALKQHALTLSQNSGMQAPIVRILAADGNINRLVRDIENMEDEMYRRDVEKMQNENQNVQAQVQQMAENAEKELAYKYHKTDEDNRTKIEMHYATLLAQSNESGDSGENIKLLELRQKALKDLDDSINARLTLELKNKELDIKREDSKNKVTVARVNK